VRIRVFSPFFPFPPDEGNFLTVYDQIVSLTTHHSVEVVSWLNTRAEVEQRKKRVSESSFRGDIPWQLLEPAAGRRPIESKLKRFFSALFNRSSTELFFYPAWAWYQAAELGPADLEVYHHTMAYPWLTQARPLNGTRRVCMVHDIQSELYDQRAAAASSPLLRWFYRHNARLLARHEAQLSKLVNELWFVSPADAKKFRSRYPHVKARVTSPTFDVTIANQRRREFHRSNKEAGSTVFGLIGDLRHTPNLASLLFILEKVCPLLLEKGFRGEIWVVGKGIPANVVMNAKRYPFLRTLGFVPDLSEFWAHLSLMLVPQVVGTGVRMKLLEALAYGVPIVAHSDATQRLHSDLQTSPLLVVRNSPSEWAEFMCTEPAFSRRRQFAGEPIPAALDGQCMYGFLNQAA
jgi:glycosyltransferase involved in cell wall biosynthesis